jgi:hypothetical protein
MENTGPLFILRALLLSAVVVFLGASPSAAQVIVTGTVTDASTGIPLYPATILDSSSSEAVQTDSAGHYRITVSGGDVLQYSYLGYYTRKWSIPARLTRIIHDEQLTSKAHQLREVQVTALSPYQQDSLERAATFGAYLREPPVPMLDKHAHPQGGFGFTLHPFSYFSKAQRRKRRFRKMYAQSEKNAFIYSRYTPALVTRLTGLKGDSLRMFLQRYQPGYAFVRHATDLQLWSWIRIRYKSWIMPR